MNINTVKRAGFFRRLAAMVYDGLIAVAVAMLAALILLAALTALFETDILSKQGYEHVSDLMQANVYYQLLVQIWMIFWVSCFFLWFWKHGGQTLGMRAWRLRLFNLHENEEKPIGYGRLIVRLISSLAGLGTLLVLIDIKSKLALQDRIAGTQMLVLSKEQNHHKNWR